jgi:hypothetical protein
MGYRQSRLPIVNGATGAHVDSVTQAIGLMHSWGRPCGDMPCYSNIWSRAALLCANDTTTVIRQEPIETND